MTKIQQFQKLQAQQQTKQLPNSQSQNFTSSNQLQRNFGNYIILKRDKYGQPTYMLGPHYYVFIIALFICVGLMCLMLYSLHGTLSPFWFYFLCGMTFLFALSYINIGISVPGIASKGQDSPQYIKQQARYCRKCKIIRAKDVYHCQECDVCIIGHDHHCPWIGKCVGSKNLSAFYFFLVMIFGTLIMCFVATLASGATNKQHLRKNTANNGKLQPQVLKIL